jgi:hypothetical protein
MWMLFSVQIVQTNFNESGWRGKKNNFLSSATKQKKLWIFSLKKKALIKKI